MNHPDSGLDLLATAAWWTMTTKGLAKALDASGNLTEEARAGFDELQSIADSGFRLGIELAKGERLGTLIDRVG